MFHLGSRFNKCFTASEPLALHWSEASNIERLKFVCRVGRQEIEVDAIFSSEVDKLISEMGMVSIEDQKHSLVFAESLCTGLWYEDVFEPV